MLFRREVTFLRRQVARRLLHLSDRAVLVGLSGLLSKERRSRLFVQLEALLRWYSQFGIQVGLGSSPWQRKIRLIEAL